MSDEQPKLEIYSSDLKRIEDRKVEFTVTTYVDDRGDQVFGATFPGFMKVGISENPFLAIEELCVELAETVYEDEEDSPEDFPPDANQKQVD